MDALQAASTCWTQHGEWALEPDSFFESPRGERTKAPPCPYRNHTERLTEIGYRWIPSSAKSNVGGGALSGSATSNPSSPPSPAPGTAPACRPWPYLRNRVLAERMLEELACRPALAVGDSMTRQFALTLDDYTSSYAPADAPVSVLDTTFVYNAYLLLNDQFFAGGARNRSNMHPWAHVLRRPHAFAMVLLSRGTHPAPTEPMMREYEAALAFVREHAPNALIVVRTTAESHPSCEQFMNRPPLKARNNATSTSTSQRNIKEQNPAVKEMVARSFRSHAVILDVEHATAFRADSHTILVRVVPGRKAFARHDCTHYCIPGPVDMWVEVWGNLMLLAARLGLLGDNDCG